MASLQVNWKDHNDAVMSVFENLYRKNTLVDCTLAAEGQYLKAHKVILSACSSYFELLLSQESEKNPIVILKDVGFQELKAAVNFMYTGEVEICEDRLKAFLEVANSLQIRGLQTVGEAQSSKNISSLLVKISSPNSEVTPCRQSRKEALCSCSASADPSPYVPADCDKISENSSSEWGCSLSSPTPFRVNSFNQKGQDIQRDAGNLETIQSSLAGLPQGSSGENEQLDLTPVLKTEPGTDSYEQEKSEELDMEFEEDLMIKENDKEWDECDVETTSDKQSTSQQDLGFSSDLMKTEEGSFENAEEVQTENHPSLEGVDRSRVDGVQNVSSDLLKDKPSSSSFGNNQEPWNGVESGSSASTPASTGTENVFISEDFLNTQSTRSSTQFYHSVFTNRSTFYETPVKLVNSSAQEIAQIPEADKHVCSKCQDVFSSSSELKKHMRYHGNNRIYKCPRCDFTTIYPSNITTHFRTHTRERPYKCPFCSHASMTTYSLRRHIRIHTGEKPYQCSECDYKSKDASALKRHRRTHTREKSFKCPYCDYRASESGNVQWHKQIVHCSGKPVQKPGL